MQDRLTEPDTIALNRRFRFRIGINAGDVIIEDRDIYGNIVNIAARLEELAHPGEIYMSRSVRDQLRGHPGLSFIDRGVHRVKNIVYPIRVYRVSARCRSAPIYRHHRPCAPHLPEPSFFPVTVRLAFDFRRFWR